MKKNNKEFYSLEEVDQKLKELIEKAKKEPSIDLSTLCTIKRKMIKSLEEDTNYGVGTEEFDNDAKDAVESASEAMYLQMWNIEDALALYLATGCSQCCSKEECQQLLMSEEDYIDILNNEHDERKRTVLEGMRVKYLVCKRAYNALLDVIDLKD